MVRLSQWFMGVLILALLFMLRPPQLGGDASYITVRQSGLEPMLYEGDLAIVKLQEEYRTGELVAIETQQGPYFGRLLGQENQIYQVRLVAGAEPIAVTPEYMLGSLWFNIGEMGRRIGSSILEEFNLSAEAAP